MNKKLLLGTTGIFILVPLIALSILELRFQSTSQKDPSFLGGKVLRWAHRGGIPANTTEGVKLAQRRGYKGVELDVFYSKDKFLVAHDEDKASNDKTLEIFLSQESGKKLNYWIDFKNLNESNSAQALKHLDNLDKSYDLKRRIAIESKNPVGLKVFSGHNYSTIFWINPYERSRLFYFRNISNKYHIITGDFSGISMNFQRYNEKVNKAFSHLNYFAFTAKSQTDISEIQKIKSVRVMLVSLENL